MKTNSDFKLDESMAVLLIGESGTGKTNVCMEFDRPYFIDFGDANLPSAVMRHPGKEFYWDRVDQDDSGKPVPPADRWKRGMELLTKNGPDPKCGAIVDDCLSGMQSVLCDHILNLGSQAEKPLTVGGVKVMTMTLWTPFKDLLRARIIQARSYGKPYIMTCHIKPEKNEVTGVLEYGPLLSGQLKDNLASLFTDYWSTQVDPNADKAKYPNGVRYYVQTVPTNRFALKCSCGLPGQFEFTWAAWQQHQAARVAARLTAGGSVAGGKPTP